MEAYSFFTDYVAVPTRPGNAIRRHCLIEPHTDKQRGILNRAKKKTWKTIIYVTRATRSPVTADPWPKRTSLKNESDSLEALKKKKGTRHRRRTRIVFSGQLNIFWVFTKKVVTSLDYVVYFRGLTELPTYPDLKMRVDLFLTLLC